VLEVLFSSRGAPAYLKSDNGPELIARQLTDWLRERGTDTYFIEPASPWQNGHNESFNSVFRDGCLDRWAFYSVQEARAVIEQWLEEYNHERPHGALADRTPTEFAALFHHPMEQAA